MNHALFPIAQSLVLLASLPLAGATPDVFPQLKPLLPPAGPLLLADLRKSEPLRR